MTRTTAGWVVLAVAMSGSGAMGQGLARRMKAPPITAAGATFAEPKGWTRVQVPEKSKTIGRFIDPGSNSADPRRMILVDFGRPTPAEKDARASAQGLAKNWGGAVVAEPTTLDGIPAYRVRAEPRGPGLTPVEGIVTHHGGRLYLIMGGAVPGQSVAGEVEEVRRGWKWAKAN